MSPEVKQVAAAVEGTFGKLFETSSLMNSIRIGRELTTKTLKKCFAELGQRLEFNVSGTGCGAEGEFLYDLVWWIRDKDGYMKRQVLVLKFELGRLDPEIDTDFQKLVQARADVRVWISHAGNPELAARHIANCKRQIRDFHATWSTTPTSLSLGMADLQNAGGALRRL